PHGDGVGGDGDLVAHHRHFVDGGGVQLVAAVPVDDGDHVRVRTALIARVMVRVLTRNSRVPCLTMSLVRTPRSTASATHACRRLCSGSSVGTAGGRSSRVGYHSTSVRCSSTGTSRYPAGTTMSGSRSVSTSVSVSRLTRDLSHSPRGGPSPGEGWSWRHWAYSANTARAAMRASRRIRTLRTASRGPA